MFDVTEQFSNSVIISYRREVSQYMALMLWQNLTERDIDVFYDLESIRVGDFSEVILGQIRARPYVVLVLAKGSLDRCIDEDDWVRREIEEALRLDRVLVPVYTPDFDFGDIELYLPRRTAEALINTSMLVIQPSYFKEAIAKLADEYLVPISFEETAVSPDAAATAASLVSGAKELRIVKTDDLSAEIRETNERYNAQLRLMPADRRFERRATLTNRWISGWDIELEDVKRGLQTLGYYDGPLDGGYSTNFFDAVIKFQNAKGLVPADGIFGQDSLGALSESLEDQ